MPINKWAGCGNLTRDAEYKQTSGGLEVLTFSIAVNERRKNNQTGEWEDYPNYFDCAIFGKRANSLARSLYRGTKVAVEGKLRQQRWEKDGQKRSAVSIVVDELEFMSRADERPREATVQDDYADEDLPF